MATSPAPKKSNTGLIILLVVGLFLIGSVGLCVIAGLGTTIAAFLGVQEVSEEMGTELVIHEQCFEMATPVLCQSCCNEVGYDGSRHGDEVGESFLKSWVNVDPMADASCGCESAVLE